MDEALAEAARGVEAALLFEEDGEALGAHLGARAVDGVERVHEGGGVLDLVQEVGVFPRKARRELMDQHVGVGHGEARLAREEEEGRGGGYHAVGDRGDGDAVGAES